MEFGWLSILLVIVYSLILYFVLSGYTVINNTLNNHSREVFNYPLHPPKIEDKLEKVYRDLDHKKFLVETDIFYENELYINEYYKFFWSIKTNKNQITYLCEKLSTNSALPIFWVIFPSSFLFILLQTKIWWQDAIYIILLLVPILGTIDKFNLLKFSSYYLNFGYSRCKMQRFHDSLKEYDGKYINDLVEMQTLSKIISDMHFECIALVQQRHIYHNCLISIIIIVLCLNIPMALAFISGIFSDITGA
jgi:hypothetical protein